MSSDFRELKAKNAAASFIIPFLIHRLRYLRFSSTLPFKEFFTAFRSAAMKAIKFAELQEDDPYFSQKTLKALQKLQKELYQDIHPEEGYAQSIANPDYAAQLFPPDFAALFSAIYLSAYQIRSAYLQKNFMHIQSLLELFLNLHDLAKKGDKNYENWLTVYRQSALEDLDIKQEFAIFNRRSSEADFYFKTIKNADLTDPRYLFRFGVYVDEHAICMSRFMQVYDAKELKSIACHIVKSFIDGFIRGKKDHTIKRYANVLIPLGMEALARPMIRELTKYELEALISAPLTNGVNRQMSYDHRFDHALILDEEWVSANLASIEKTYEKHKELLAVQAGPLYVELFGETPFSPTQKEKNLRLSAEQQKLWQSFGARSSRIYNQYLRRHESSFTIIAFPSPEIGENFPAIFADTLQLNLLDSERYAKIQQHIIDVLDTAAYVQVKGKAGNDTDIKVMMQALPDPASQTLFENCVADVNIPVGEVFTSPQLTGTTGTLHVEDIYLNDLRFLNLKLHFEDGWVKDYSCTNFADAAQGKRYIHENLLLPHESLPLGEFAIGTNTHAYQMAKKYNIMHLLPILIIEKMGPHFAIGDTCYSHEEDLPHPSFYNGKEMIAVENEKSALRKSNPLNAYTQKHTDITLPYEMLDSITAITLDGKKSPIIKGGRFVVPGTEELNIPLDS